MSNPQKENLLAWVNDRFELDIVSKFILYRLAMLADGECCAWAKIDTLAEAVNKTDRTVQTRLSALQRDGYIENTGRTHRLANSTRSVPIYQIAPGIEGLDPRVSMGEKFSPIEPVWVKSQASMGEAIFTRIGTEGTEGESYDSPERERARERACFADLEAAYPKAGLRTTDREAAWIALCAAADAGVEVERLADCARAMAAHPSTAKRDFGPPAMQAWLARGQYRGWWPDEEPAADAAPAEPVAGDRPDAIPDDVVAAIGADFVKTWAGDAAWLAEDRTIVTRLGVQAARFRNDKRAVLLALGVRVICRAEAAAVAEPAPSRQPQDA